MFSEFEGCGMCVWAIGAADEERVGRGRPQVVDHHGRRGIRTLEHRLTLRVCATKQSEMSVWTIISPDNE